MKTRGDCHDRADELRERSRVDSRPPAPDLGAWLVANEFATRADGGLAPTALARELGAAID